jgi:transcriptional regulator with XRE-family HTH domain
MTEDRKKFREIDHKEMGRRIRDRREALGLSREDLSELLDVSAQFIADVEYGNKGLSIKRLYLLSQVLDVTTDYILAGSLYSFETDGEATRFREEIMELIYKCDAKQLKGIREITEIYVDGVSSK